MIQPIQKSACHYLFEKEANEAFDTSQFSEELINQSLEIMMRVNVAFLSKKENDGFSLLDPAAFNNQCHFYALFSAKIRNHYKTKSLEEKLAKTQENRFLHLLFLLSFTFLNERRLLCEAIRLAANQDKIALPANQKLFNDFIKDSQGFLVRTARQSLNEVFERCIKETFCAAQEKGLLHKELYQLSLEDLRLPASRGHINLYTFPKLAGVAYLINENMPMIIKSKVVTPEGTVGTLVYQSAPIKEDESVLVFEAITSEQLSIDQLEEMAKGCPSYFFRNVSSRNRHKDNESCLFCHSASIDLEPYQTSFKKATTNIDKSLHALGADFIKELQLPFMKFFKDPVKYPMLTEIFQKAVPNIDALGLSMKKPIAFTVDHIYVDDARHALQPQLRMNSSPETYLKERGFL
jgi:hypothetical protein